MFPKWQTEINDFDFASGHTGSSQPVINSQEIWELSWMFLV